MGSIPVPELITHTQRVKSLYKLALRNLESWFDRRDVYRYMTALMRARFERSRYVKDQAVARSILREGEKELRANLHWHIRRFPDTPYGTAHGRDVPPWDWAMDMWHPLEKAQYPQYFAKREELKKKFVEMWKEQYGED